MTKDSRKELQTFILTIVFLLVIALDIFTALVDNGTRIFFASIPLLGILFYLIMKSIDD